VHSLFTHTTPGSTVNINGQEHLFFSGFAYLGLHTLPAFKTLLKEGIDRYGTVFMSSRLANLQLSLYDELEHHLAVLLHQAAAVTFSSGYLASQAAIYFAADKGTLLYAPGTHPSLWFGQATVPVCTWREWVDQTIETVNAQPDNQFVIVANGVNPLTSTVNDFSWLTQIQRKVLVLIDDSHGIGILGLEGNGIIHSLPANEQLDYLIAASLAKAYSVEAGMISGSGENIAAIKKQPFFSGGTPMMPANAYAFLQSGDLHIQQRIILHQRIAHFKVLTGMHNPFLLPAFVLENAAGIENYLLNHQVVISSFSYPFPDSPPINRIVVCAHHSDQQLALLHKLLKNYQRQ
jgi:8-amino-7-oxononanoate synthase